MRTIPKYNVGDALWTASIESVRTMVPCPDCDGKGVFEIPGKDFVLYCPTCFRHSSGLGRIPTDEFKPVVRLVFLTQVDVSEWADGSDLRYLSSDSAGGGSYVHSEEGLFETKEAALAWAAILAETQKKEAAERLERIRLDDLAHPAMKKSSVKQRKR
jgi:hypothetical protein